MAVSARPPFGPPFDRETGRKGRRHVPAPDPDAIPLTIRYRFSQSGVPVPPDFDPHLVTRSAQPPAASLKREFVYGARLRCRHGRQTVAALRACVGARRVRLVRQQCSTRLPLASVGFRWLPSAHRRATAGTRGAQPERTAARLPQGTMG
jgi:hypothetical protein